MKDAIKKGNGRSRFMKAAISPTLTWEQFRSMLINGSLPFDMDINESTNPADSGWEQFGTRLTKATLLSADTCYMLRLDPEAATVNDAFNAVMFRSLYNVYLVPNEFEEVGTYEDFPYEARIYGDGITADLIPDVIFDIPEATSGNFAPNAATEEGAIVIYAAAPPDDEIIIPLIRLWRRTN